MVYDARGLYFPRVIDSKSTHFYLAWVAVSSISIVEAIHYRMDRPLAIDVGSVWSPVRIVSCSLVSAFVKRLYRVVLAEVHEGG